MLGLLAKQSAMICVCVCLCVLCVGVLALRSFTKQMLNFVVLDYMLACFQKVAMKQHWAGGANSDEP